ncbi:MAG: S8 family peptidase [Gemmatimonadales bacterium]|nr:S8 family peptidase [Gemmatimonadales bacterium]
MTKTPKWSRLIPLAIALSACQNDTVDPAASRAPANAPRASLDARADSSKLVSAPGEKVPNSYILKTHTDKDARAVAAQLAAEHTATVKYVYPSLPGLAVTLPNPDDLPKPTDLSKLLEDRRIVRVSEERILQATGLFPSRPSEETSLDTQTAGVGWNLDKLDSREFATNGTYRYEETASSVPVYVIDSGTISHGEFGGRVLPGVDLVGLSDGRGDYSGHGTAVASVIGGNTTGVAKTVQLVPVRITHNREADESTFIAGIEWVIARNMGFGVANISFATPDTVDADVDEIVQRLVADGVTTVVGAGNYDKDACKVSPARLTEVITVSAVDSNGNRSVFNSEEHPAATYGACVDIWAPGNDVRAVYSQTHEIHLWSGTSVAAPHVTAVAWLILREENNRASPAHIKDVILSSATEGRLNVNGPNRFLYAPRSVAWISGPSSVTSSGSQTWSGRGWGGYSLTYLWETSTDGGTTWTAAGTGDRYTRSFNSRENYTLTLRLTVTNDFDEQPSVTWTIPVDTGCGETVCPG